MKKTVSISTIGCRYSEGQCSESRNTLSGNFRMKKSIIASMFAGIIISTAGMAEAACDIWFDREADIDRFQKVVVYPITAKNRNNFL